MSASSRKASGSHDKAVASVNHPGRCVVCGADLWQKNVISDEIANWCAEHGFNPERPYIPFVMPGKQGTGYKASKFKKTKHGPENRL